MRPRLLRLLSALVAVLCLGTSASLRASATTAGAQQPLSKAGCAAFNDYFQVNFAVAFLTGFAEAFEDLGTTDGDGDTGQQTDIDQLQNIVFLVLSPKLEESTAVLAKQAPKSIRKVFAAQRDVYRDGVALLQDDLGVSDEQIELIRNADFTQETPDALADELDITKADLEAAAEEFGESSGVLTAEDATAAQSRAFQRVAIGCGTVPDSEVNCDEIVSVDLQEQLLGGSATVEDSDGTCTYTGAETADGDEPELAVDIYRNADAFDRLAEQNEAAEAIDDDNATAEGFVTFSSFKTCGRTLFSREGSVTVVVALCPPDDGEVSDTDLTEVRASVAEFVG